MLQKTQELKRISKETFMKATDEITNLFPGEVKESYYMPYCSAKTGLRKPARGKLWSRYVNVKAALRLANQSLIQKELGNKEESVPTVLAPEIEAELVFLKTGIEPRARILSAWEQTFDLRYKLYFNDKKIEDLTEIFPCLKTEYGLELDLDELEDILSRRKLQLDKFNLAIQPFGVYIQSTQQYLIIYNDIRYKCVSCIRTIELLFKAIHPLNLEYSSESKHIWHFIEELIFDMQVSGKNTST
ncbi:hypothetical protein NQ315_016039, partial [Exocentrus adspersus]